MGLGSTEGCISLLTRERKNETQSQLFTAFLMQILWVIPAIVAPCFHFVAGIAPLFISGNGNKDHGGYFIIKYKTEKLDIDGRRNECMELDINGRRYYLLYPLTCRFWDL